MFKNISSSFKITIAYLIFGILWILISDSLVNFFVQDTEKIQFIQLFKGWFFIFLSAFIIHLISHKLFIDLQKAKEETDEANSLLENIINNAPIRIFWKNKNGKYLGANKLFLEDMNIKSIDDLVGKGDKSLNVKEKQEYINDDAFVMNNNTKKLNYIETITFLDGKRHIVSTSKVPLLDKHQKVVGVLGVYQDITQQVEIENQMKKQESMILQQSKFTSMGEMLANVAHQWRQPLSIISTSATGLKLQKEEGISNEQFELEALDSINENVQYLSHTIEDFRNFFKDEKMLNEVSLEEIINKTLSLVGSRLSNKNIQIQTHYENIVFKTFETELLHVFINIINNAIDALETKNGEKLIFIRTEQSSDSIVIKIKDNAGGIDPNIIARIFEPYFTTKDSSKGTGIGLYMCKEIVVKHLNGKINVENKVFKYEGKEYKGCEFTIEILL